MIKFLTFTAVFVGFSSFAGVYKCTVDGKEIYSQTECEEGTQVRLYKLEKIQQSEKTHLSTTNSVSNNNRSNANDTTVEAHIINNKIKRSQKKIESYQSKMRRELAALKTKTYYAANNNAGANYHNALSNEMQAVSEKYKTYINIERENISEFRRQIAALRN